MKKLTTTSATYRGIKILVFSDNTGHGTTYSCTSDSGQSKAMEKWFATEGEALANERHEIDALVRQFQ